MRIKVMSMLRKILLTTALLLSISSVPAAAAPGSAAVAEGQADSIFDIANEEYKAGNYENAITLYEGLLSDSGITAADIHYNIGNASYRLGNYGKAIAAYRRALRLAPRDQDIVANLDLARDAAVDKMDRPSNTELVHEMLFFHFGLNPSESEAIFFCAFVSAALFATVSLFRKTRFLHWLTLTALVLAFTFGTSTAARWYRARNPNQAVVTAKEAEIHTGPGDKYLLSINLHDGAELTVRKTEAGWHQVELPDGRRGWVEESMVEII